MRNPLDRILFWAPRVLALVFALFISIFALDVFDAGFSAGELIIALLIHLIPTALVAIALAIACRWEWAGAILFAALGALYIVIAWEWADWIVYLLISGPLFLIAILFLVDWIYRRQAKPGIG